MLKLVFAPALAIMFLLGWVIVYVSEAKQQRQTIPVTVHNFHHYFVNHPFSSDSTA